MVTLPITSSWSLRSLGESDRDRALAFLEREPLLNAYLISKILDEGMTASQFLEVKSGGSPVCLASVASNVVMGVAPESTAEEREVAIALLGERILGRAIPVRAIISDATLVEMLWRHLRIRLDPPTVVRMNQPIYSLKQADEVLPDLQRVRYAGLDDLDVLVPACAAMHREEVGIDPLERDAAGYRQRIRELILKRRSLVLAERRKIVFKCEFSAVTSATVQLMGLWTSPDFRRQGYARSGLREICGHILRQRKVVTLFVNDFNTPAIRLYESLGFQPIGRNCALIW